LTGDYHAGRQRRMSAFEGKADMAFCGANVCS
jgi:hypothetical protein